MMRVVMTDGQDRTVSIQVTGKYSPDILEDVSRRASRAYQEMLTAQALMDGDAEMDPDDVQAELDRAHELDEMRRKVDDDDG